MPTSPLPLPGQVLHRPAAQAFVKVAGGVHAGLRRGGRGRGGWLGICRPHLTLCLRLGHHKFVNGDVAVNIAAFHCFNDNLSSIFFLLKALSYHVPDPLQIPF